MNKVNYNDLVEYLQNNIDTLKDMVQEVNSYNGYLDNYYWYNNDEYFYEDFFADKDEVARSVYYGGKDYNYCDEFVRFDAYGNLETANNWEIEQDLQDGTEEILDAFLEEYNNNNVNVYDTEFNEMLEKYTEESEEQ